MHIQVFFIIHAFGTMDRAWEASIFTVVVISFMRAHDLFVTESFDRIVPTSIGTSCASHVVVVGIGFIIGTFTAETRALRTRVVPIIVIRTSGAYSLLVTASAKGISPTGFFAD